MTNDPFHVKSGRRAAVPPDEYWQLLDELALGTLTGELLPDPEQMRDRFVQLTDAEPRLGVVYVGERQWLDAALFHEFPGNYYDWVLSVFNQSVLCRPLRWAAYCDSGDHASPSSVDLWAAEVREGVLPTHLVKELKDSTIFDFDPLIVGSYGKQDAPSSAHLIALFERLHNFPYYVWENRALLVDQWEDTHNHITEVIVGDSDNADRWLIAEDNHYSAYSEFVLQGRLRLDSVDDLENFNNPSELDRLLMRVQESIRPEDCHPRAPLHGFNRWGDRGLNRALLRNRDRLDEDVRHQIESSATDSEYRWRKQLAWPAEAERPLTGSATLLDVELTCCGRTTTHAQFERGTRLDSPDYHIGDSIRWDAPFGNELNPVLTDYSDRNSVLVRGKPEQPCAGCGQREVLIRVEDQRTIGVDHERTNAASYVFQAPFFEDDDLLARCWQPELGELVNWDEFTTLWMLQQAELLSPSVEQARLVDCLQQYAESYGTVAGHLLTWLQFRLRDQMSDLHYLRAMEFGEVRFYQPTSTPPDRSTAVKSLALLQLTHDDHDYVAGFHWGSLLNFPEYQIGDTIRWSEYSFGTKDADVVYASPNYLLGVNEQAPASLLERGLIKIVDGVIVGLEPHQGDSPIGYYLGEPLAYVGATPYLIWPDEDFLR